MARVPKSLQYLVKALQAGAARLDLSFSPMVSLRRLSTYNFTIKDTIYIFHALLVVFWVSLMQEPAFPYKLLIPVLYITILLIPFTSQVFLPAVPVLSWVLSWYCAKFIPEAYRPSISVILLPTLESVLYGANISDILTRYTTRPLDVIAWLPYGVFHFAFPVIVAILLYLFRSKPVLHLWGKVFGYTNLFGVFVQILFPCAPPWYEVIHGLTPANYGMKGSPGGLARIDELFGGSGYTVGFSNSPVIFGAFPSLHAGNATLEALFISHFFPKMTKFAWGYAGVLYWATMYLTHHYLIDVVGGACFAISCFYIFLPDELRGKEAYAPPANLGGGARTARQKYEQYGLESPPSRANGGRARYPEDEFEVGGEDSDGDEGDVAYYRTPNSNSKANGSAAPKRSHRHTASIASLIRGDERAPEDGWSPITTNFPADVGGSSSANGNGTGRPNTPSGRPRTPMGERRTEDA